ncbi:hypothetical protein JXJ21_09315 [candidate division KSB1 bacterium]|nr:hypothetical protein [candidate division KSB1 bacterium]
MKSCNQETLIIEFLTGNLDEPQRSHFRKHLAGCAKCKERHDELQNMHGILLSRKRPAFAGNLLRHYQNDLNEFFPSRLGWVEFKQRVCEWTAFVINSRSMGIRIARAAVMIMVGIFIGRSMIDLSSEKKAVQILPETQQIQLTSAEYKMLQNYILESEILLLDILNEDFSDKLESSDFKFNKQIATKLILHSSFMRKKTQQLNNEAMIELMNRLEFLLIEISNVCDEELAESLSTIQQAIVETKLLIKMKQFQKLLTRASGQPI